MIREVLPHKLHLVYDETYTMTLVRLEKTGTEYLHQVNLFRPIFQILVKSTFVYLAFQSGDIDFMDVKFLQDKEIENQLDRKVTNMPNKLNQK